MITQGQCTVFKVNLLKGLENFNAGSPYVYKLALYTDSAELGPDTTVYTTAGEVVGTGYVAGGNTLTPVAPTSEGDTAYVTFNELVWTPASFTTKGALIYNATTNAAVAVLNFGSDRVAINTFTVTFPTANATNAIIRFE
jgi:hypothetical protein